MKSKYFFRKLFCIAVVFSILLIAALIPLEYNNINTLSFFDVQSSVNPTFRVHPQDNSVHGEDWGDGVLITLTVDDPSNGTDVDYSETQTAYGEVEFNIDFDIQPGFLITMSDGIITKEHTVAGIKVISMDPESDQVSGLAAEGSEVVVEFWGDEGCNAQRYVTSVAPGTWTADFTEPGEDPRDTDICDIDEWEGNQEGGVVQRDNDYDSTCIHFPKASFEVTPEDDRVESWDWPENAQITLTIDDPGNGIGIDYTDTQTSTLTEEGTRVDFTFGDVIDIQPGFRVTVTDGNFIKAHIVTDLQVLSMDPVTDQVSGTATPNSRIRVRFWVGCNAVRDVTTDENGAWTVDFSLPGEEPGDFGDCDIDAFNNMRGHAKQKDNDYDGTRINFPNKWVAFGVFLEDDYAFSRNWPENAEVTINIDDPETIQKPDYTDTQISTKVDSGTLVEFYYEDEIDVQPEFLVTMTDGNFTKGHVVTIFEVLDVDTEEDMISGIAEPFSQINIRLSGVCEAKRTQSSDAYGVWIADFSQPGDDPDEGQICDIDESVSGQAVHSDDDWDSTNYWIRNNVEITALENPVEFGESVQITAKFTDPTIADIETYDTGTSDKYTAIWDWGDDSQCDTDVDSDCSITESPYGHSGTVSGSHTYDEPGVYTINLSISDNAYYDDEATYKYIVIYNPEGGFVIGGGWIDSPEGAYLADPALSGKANFGFVSEYKKGASVPTGNTEFQFKTGDLNFHSSNYDWLVVTGSDYARFKGTGTINSEGEYKFMLWAGDGTGIESADTFRIKIWYEVGDTEFIAYDNRMNQEIGGGNIVVHIK